MGFFSRLGLAIVCFFKILAGSKLPERVRLLGIEGAEPAAALPEPKAPEPPPAAEEKEPEPPPPPPPIDETKVIERGGLLMLGLRDFSWTSSSRT